MLYILLNHRLLRTNYSNSYKDTKPSLLVSAASNHIYTSLLLGTYNPIYLTLNSNFTDMPHLSYATFPDDSKIQNCQYRIS